MGGFWSSRGKAVCTVGPAARGMVGLAAPDDVSVRFEGGQLTYVLVSISLGATVDKERQVLHFVVGVHVPIADRLPHVDEIDLDLVLTPAQPAV